MSSTARTLSDTVWLFLAFKRWLTLSDIVQRSTLYNVLGCNSCLGKGRGKMLGLGSVRLNLTKTDGTDTRTVETNCVDGKQG